MNTKATITIIKTAAQVIAVLFGLFGGFLLKVAPPSYDEDIQMAIGITQFVSLLIFLFLSVILNQYAKKGKRKSQLVLKIWLGLVGLFIIVFVWSSISYYKRFDELTVWHSVFKTRFVRGAELTNEAQEECKSRKIDSQSCESELLYDYFNYDEIAFENRLWTKQSVQRSKNSLFNNYLTLIISLSGALFALIEIISVRKLFESSSSGHDKRN